VRYCYKYRKCGIAVMRIILWSAYRGKRQ